MKAMPTDGEPVTIVGERGHAYTATGRAVPGPGVDLDRYLVDGALWMA